MDSQDREKGKSERLRAMTGKVLIVDDVATNRIVFKAKLTEASYAVGQAASGCAALACVASTRPDLILASSRLPDMDTTAFLRALRAQPTARHTPVLMLTHQDTPAQRRTALEAGATEIMDRRTGDSLLLARLRSLLRRHHAQQDLRANAAPTAALGLAEGPPPFHPAERIGLIAAGPGALRLRADLMRAGVDTCTILPPERAIAAISAGRARADAFLLRLSEAEAGLRLMAELRAAPRTRACPILILLEAGTAALAATALDMGADGVVLAPACPRELRLRLSTLLAEKHEADRLRNTVQDGLQAALTDPLTGLHNRRYALPRLERMIRAAARADRSLAVMVADLDHFKKVNDANGHAAGDAVLRQVAARLRAPLSEADLIARIGGEEFLIALPGATRATARSTAARICRAVRDSPFALAQGGDPLRITVSIGVTLSRPATCGTLPSPEGLLDQADRALYGAKAGGRNTVTLATRPAA
jgi:two-component system cell cycle response regulator